MREQRDSCEKNLSENIMVISGRNMCKPGKTSPPVTITQLPALSVPQKFTNPELMKTNHSRMNGHYYSNPQSQNPISAATITLKTTENSYKRKSQEGKHIMAELPPSRPATLTACTVATTRLMSPTTNISSVGVVKMEAADMRILPRNFSSPTSDLYQR